MTAAGDGAQTPRKPKLTCKLSCYLPPFPPDLPAFLRPLSTLWQTSTRPGLQLQPLEPQWETRRREESGRGTCPLGSFL